MTDWGALAQQAAEEHLDDLYEKDAANSECGCQTCLIREVLTAAWPVIDRMVVHEVALAVRAMSR